MHLLGGQSKEKMGGVGGDKAITQPDQDPYKELRPIGGEGTLALKSLLHTKG